MRRFEVNLDGLTGPTHNYAGLGLGNFASQNQRGRTANPRAAALQGLDKMWRLHALGLPQMVLPPAPRPHLAFLRRLGFTGADTRVIERAGRDSPRWLAIAYSASSMWTANAATMCPSADAADGKAHFTPANLIRQPHRSLEADFTAHCLRAVFPSPGFVHHAPLPAAMGWADEGAANHTRFSGPALGRGVHLFVYGADGPDRMPRRQVPRQDYAASAAVARLHGLNDISAVFAAQAPAAVDAGVFHNDVISTGHEDFFLYHEQGFASPHRVLRALRRAFRKRCGRELRLHPVGRKELTLAEAVSTYLFNSQIVTLPDGAWLWLAAEECRRHVRARAVLEKLAAAGVARVEYVNLRQSMRNGGGPACLRLRVELTEPEWRAAHAGVKFSEEVYASLKDCVMRGYRDRLSPGDLRDPELMRESQSIQAEILEILGLKKIGMAE